MADKVFPDVTLANADLALLQCWKEKVSEGFECSLTLKHSRGVVTTILTSRSSRIPEPRKSKPAPKTPAGDTKRKKGSSKKRLEALLSYQKRLVEEKGLPPSRLMLEQAASAPPSPPPAEKGNASIFKCDLCYYYTHSKHGLSVHRGAKHKNKQKHESSHLVNLESVVTSSKDKDKNAQNSNITENSSKILTSSFCLKDFPNMMEFNEHKLVTEYGVCRLCVKMTSNCAAQMDHMEDAHKKSKHNWIRDKIL